MHAAESCLISSAIKPVKGAGAALLAIVGMVEGGEEALMQRDAGDRPSRYHVLSSLSHGSTFDVEPAMTTQALRVLAPFFGRREEHTSQ